MAPGEIPEIDEESSVYEFRGLLGKGSFNKVFKALHKQTHEEIAVKVGASISQNFVSIADVSNQVISVHQHC